MNVKCDQKNSVSVHYLVLAYGYICSLFSTEEEFVEPPDELKIEDDDIEVIIVQCNSLSYMLS